MVSSEGNTTRRKSTPVKGAREPTVTPDIYQSFHVESNEEIPNVVKEQIDAHGKKT